MGKIVYLSLGSNLGNRLELLEQAVQAIHSKAGTIRRISSVYETPPWGFEAETSFLNLCLELDTILPPEALLHLLHDIEFSLGRVRHADSAYHSRSIDIDIVDYNNEIHSGDGIQLPHPRYTERTFVLLPLSEIAPNFTDPKSAKSIHYLRSACLDESPVALHESKISFNL